MHTYVYLNLPYPKVCPERSFKFLPNGDGPARYRIINFRRNQFGEFEWKPVGLFKDGQLQNVRHL